MKALFSRYYSEIISVLLLLITIPFYVNVNFMQNDDWAYYQNIQNFLSGNFYLIPKTAPTFYTIGILATLWSSIFGVTFLPFLTLLISVGNFYIFTKILEMKFKLSKFSNIFISLILLTNFLHSYSSIGFMTENYLVFFLLLSILYFEKFQKFQNLRNLHLSNLFSVLTFFVKQSGLIFICATAVYFLIKKDFQKLKIQIAYLASISIFYFFIFPKTSEMVKKNFVLDNLARPDYMFSLIYGILIYLAFFTLPLIWNFISEFAIQNKNNYKKLVLTIVLVSSAYFYFNNSFKPENLAWQEFPYFENVFERTGFLPRTITGTKYQFKFNFDYYSYSDLISKVSVAFVMVLLVLNYRKIINVYAIAIFGFMFLMLFAYPFFDRYIIYVLPLAILLLADFYSDKLFGKIILGIFVLYQSYFSYFLVRDFIQTHNFVWSRSEKISLEDGSFDMKSTGAWTNTYGRNRMSPKYIFTYDSLKKNPGMKETYDLVETYKVEFRGNLFIEPAVYLYKRKN